jgi:hypothetical protein
VYFVQRLFARWITYRDKEKLSVITLRFVRPSPRPGSLCGCLFLSVQSLHTLYTKKTQKIKRRVPTVRRRKIQTSCITTSCNSSFLEHSNCTLSHPTYSRAGQEASSHHTEETQGRLKQGRQRASIGGVRQRPKLRATMPSSGAPARP